MAKESPNVITEKVVRCRCGEKLYERINLTYTPWAGQAFKRTLHDNKGNQVKKCPRCNTDFALPPPLPEDERKQLREKIMQRYAHIDLSTHEARITFFPMMQFKQLIQRHLNRSMQQIAESINSEMMLLDEKERKASEILIDIFNAQANYIEFWEADCNFIFTSIWDKGVEIAKNLGIEPDDYLIFSLFQLVVLSFAYFAYENKDFSKIVGLKLRKKTNNIFKKWHLWIYGTVVGGYLIYNFITTGFMWEFILIAGCLALIIMGYFWTFSGYK